MHKYFVAIFSLLVLVSSKKDISEIEKTDEKGNIEKFGLVKEFGLNLDNFKVYRDTVRNGDSFGALMLKNKVGYSKIYNISENFRNTFDVRRIIVGKPYLILKSKDSSEVAKMFIYQNDLINYTVIDLRDSVVVYKNRNKVTYREREVAGIITSSLSKTILIQGIDSNLANNLSDIYAWTINFFRLQKGDKFKVIYKEKFINDSIYAGVCPIEAAFFEHKGRAFYAFGYKTDSLKGSIDYFDDKANNLRRTFLRAPVKFSKISSRYNLKRRIKYYGYKRVAHKGTDYAASIGTPIIATADGTVVESTRRGGNGKYVKIKHNGTYSTQYLHMKNRNVRKGDFVKQGDVIGWIGMTGNTGGPHVCYRFWKNGRQIDPLREKLPMAEPIPEELKEQYKKFIVPRKVQLDRMEYYGQAEEMLLTDNR